MNQNNMMNCPKTVEIDDFLLKWAIRAYFCPFSPEDREMGIRMNVAVPHKI